METAVREVPEAAPQKPLRRHRPLADNVNVNADERGGSDFGAGIDDWKFSLAQHVQQVAGVLGAQIGDNAVEPVVEGVVCDFCEWYLLQGEAALFLHIPGDARENPLRKRWCIDRIGDECDLFVFPWLEWMLYFHCF